MREEQAMTVAMEAGYKKPLCRISLADKTELISLITIYIKVKAHMDDFKEGLELFGVYQYITKYQCLLRPLYVDESTRITASKFMNVHVCFETRHTFVICACMKMSLSQINLRRC